MATTLSDAGAKFIGRNEGFETRAYKDSGGVVTIGHGFTWGSKVFRDYWNKTRGYKLRMGDTIMLDESLTLLKQLADLEYGKAADQALPNTVDAAQFDAATDYLFNCGVGSVKDKWFVALASGNVAEAARLIKSSRITAGGRQLPGLVNRRTAESRLISTGNYNLPTPKIGSPPPTISVPPDEVRWYQQQLATLGLYSGNIDGDPGKLTDGAVRNFQRQQGLDVDGVVGPATRAALIRAVDAKVAKGSAVATTTAGAGAGGAVATSSISGPTPPPQEIVNAVPWHTIEWLIGLGLVGLLIAGAAFLVWRNRGVIFGFRTPT